MEPEVIADISNHVFYANAVPASKAYLSDDIKNNPAIYPPEDIMKKLFSLQVMPPKVDRIITRNWTKIVTDN